VLQGNERLPSALWLDSGLVFLHTRAARSTAKKSLQTALTLVSSHLRTAGVTLLPSAIKSSPEQPWSSVVSGDEHAFEVLDELERATFCNLVRSHLPRSSR